MTYIISTSSLYTIFTSPRNLFDKAVAHLSAVNQHFDGVLNYMHPLAFATNNSSNDTFTLKKVLKQDHVGSCVEAMTKEVQAHKSRSHWTPVLRSSLPENTKTILSI